jgi:hypothetical protein
MTQTMSVGPAFSRLPTPAQAAETPHVVRRSRP